MMQKSSSTESPATPVRMLAAGARYNGTYILGAEGSGKSALEAALAWQDYLRGIGQIIIDPIGVGLTDAFLWKLLRFLQQLPFTSHYRYLERIKYVNIAEKTISCPFL